MPGPSAFAGVVVGAGAPGPGVGGSVPGAATPGGAGAGGGATAFWAGAPAVATGLRGTLGRRLARGQALAGLGGQDPAQRLIADRPLKVERLRG